MALKRLLKWTPWRCDKLKFNLLQKGLCYSLYVRNRFTKVEMQPKIAYFKKDEVDQYFSVSLRFEYAALSLQKNVSLHTPVESSVKEFLQKISLKIYRILERTTRKKKLPDDIVAVNTMLYLDGERFPEDFDCSKIFGISGEFILYILSESYAVYCNTPWVNSLSLPQIVRSGMIIQPLKFDASFTNKEKSTFTWSRSARSILESRESVKTISDWVEIGNKFCYVVTKNDIDCYLKLECIPRNDKETGPSFSEVITSPVEPAPGDYYFENTHKLTAEKADENKFRVMTYNVLADMYTSTKEGKVIFHYCPGFVLEKKQRYSVICRELMGYNADLICLQEVDFSNFNCYLLPVLSELDYYGFVCLKSQDREGTAFFINKNKFNLLGSQNFVFGREIQTNRFLSDIWNYVKQSDGFLQKYTSLPHTLQLIALKSNFRENEVIIVGNVHLYSSPEADIIRLLQSLSIFGLFQSFVKELKSLLADKNISLLICGDFNSTPKCPVHEVVMSGSLSPSHKIWEKGEMKEFKGFLYNLPVRMGSAFGTPPYTNYTELFKNCLDYIYYQTDRLEVDKVYPLASEAELSANVGIPSVSFPSDHLPLIVDMKWRY